MKLTPSLLAMRSPLLIRKLFQDELVDKRLNPRLILVDPLFFKDLTLHRLIEIEQRLL